MTVDEPFVYSGKEKTLFVASLRAFSDNCEVPKLTPTCPFFELTATGPSCGEQCHDLLANHPSEGLKPRPIYVGDGLEAVPIRRPRNRRGPSPTSQSFDAAKIRIRDQRRPTDSKHTASLFHELYQLSRIAPFFAEDAEERAYLMRAYVAELERRGFSRSELIGGLAYGVGAAMAATLSAFVFLKRQMKEDDRESAIPPLPPEWASVRDEWLPSWESTEALEGMRRMLSKDFIASLREFARGHELDGLIDWAAPPAAAVGVPPRDPEFHELERGRWLFDRFTNTYLHDWERSSLDLEWRYVHSSVRGCGSSEEMAKRRVEVDQLAREIADRSVVERNATQDRAKRIAPEDFTSVILDHLNAGRYIAAVTLLDGIRQLRPTDELVLNNLGFCQIAINLEEAIETLNESIAMSRRPSSLTVANLAFAHFRLGHLEEAIRHAHLCLTLEPQTGVYLWAERADGSLAVEANCHTGEYAKKILNMIELRTSVDE